MRRIQTTIAVACAAFALTAVTAVAQTEVPNRLTYVTFSGPVSVPGVTLPAGTYEFKILDSNTNRNIVQIFNREGTKIFATLLAVPATRLEPTGDPIITFKETPSDRPPAVHYWYYAGDLAGNELVYPKDQAQMIANASGEDVMSVDANGSSIDDWKKGSISKMKPNHTAANTQSSTSSATSTTTDQGSPKPATPPATTTTADQTAQSTQPTTTAPPSDQRPSRTMDQSAQPTTAPAPQPPATAAPDTSNSGNNTAVGTSGHKSRRLPKTASDLPMIGLIGLIALGGALALRVARTA